MTAIGSIYDALAQFEQGKRQPPYPVHKALRGPASWLTDWLREQVPLAEGARVLDAGCGNGNTLFELAKHQAIEGVGVSLSPQEIAVAQSLVPEGQALSFRCQSYDEPLGGPYHLIVACESLRHSSRYPHTLRHWWQHLAPGGTLALADDMVRSTHREEPALVRHRQMWATPSVFTREDVQNALPEATLQAFDFTHRVPTRPHRLLRRRIRTITALRRLASAPKRRLLDIYLGGLLLELGYAHGWMTYQGILLQKSILNVEC